ncbi:MAG: phosphoglucosamine mutase [Clostridia bacterium]|nr:phosphoglucosamine mutase [Clostridia bacterium]
MKLFGTDGVRGVANSELTVELAMQIGRCAASVLSNGSDHRPVVAIGTDTRASADMLTSAIAAGVCSMGANVLLLGVVTTPAIAFLLEKLNADAGIMISASHNSAEFNGIKIFSKSGYKLPEMLEEQIEDLIEKGDDVTKRPIGGEVGTIRQIENASRQYIDHIKNSIDSDLSGLNIAIDCANGSASATARTLFSELGASIFVLSDSPDGVNINKDCGSTHTEALAKFVVENHLDCGVAFDGDADRCLCVDENGELIDGDKIMAICSLDMKQRGILNKNTVVGTIMSNFGFSKFCEENDIDFVATKVGDRFVLEEMLQNGYSLGGEQSGHVIFREYATTGDGQLTSVQLLSLLKRSGKKLSELASVMKRYPQSMINVKISKQGKLKFYTDAEVVRAIDKAEKELSGSGRLVVRPSGTEPLLRVMVESLDADQADRVAKEVAEVIVNRLGNV